MYTKENWAEMIQSMNSGKLTEIDNDIYQYFLGVLPPVSYGKVYEFDGVKIQSHFGMAEGYDYITAFWHEGNRCFCRQTNVMNRG